MLRQEELQASPKMAARGEADDGGTQRDIMNRQPGGIEYRQLFVVTPAGPPFDDDLSQRRMDRSGVILAAPHGHVQLSTVGRLRPVVHDHAGLAQNPRLQLLLAWRIGPDGIAVRAWCP